MLKFINFLHTPTINDHKKISRWYRFSCGATTTIFASLCAISVIQMLDMKSLNNELEFQQPIHEKAHNLLEEFNTLSKEKEKLLHQTEEYEKYTHYAKKPADMLTAIEQSTDEKKIQSLCMMQQSVSFQMNVRSTHEGIQIAQNISRTTVFNCVNVTDIQSADNTMIATICCENKKTDI